MPRNLIFLIFGLISFTSKLSEVNFPTIVILLPNKLSVILPYSMLSAFKLVIWEPSAIIFVALIVPFTSNNTFGSISVVFIPTLPEL